MIDPRSTRAYKLEKENKRLIELCNKYEEEHKTAFKLWTMKMEEMPNYEESISLKQRNEKAIEYMNEVLECNYHGGNVTFDDLVHNTEHILRGADKE